MATIAAAAPNSATTSYREYLDSELASEGERSIHGIISQVARYGALKFGALTLSHPFDAARLLRQLQYGSGVVAAAEPSSDDHRRESVSSFLDPTPVEQQREEERQARSHSRRIGELYSKQGDIGDKLPAELCRDPSGYIIEKSTTTATAAQQSTTQWPLVLDKRRSLWHTIGEISHRQGLFSVWQGIFAGWTHDILMDLGRATVEEALDGSELLQDSLAFSFAPVELQDELLKPCIVAGLAQGIVGTVLCPFEVARIRLMAQSVWTNEHKYHGLFKTLRVIAREEGGLLGLFKNPLLTFAAYFLKPVLRILPISLLNLIYSPAESTSLPLSLAWLFTQNLAMCAPLIITMPLETIRRRLMVQCTSALPVSLSGSPQFVTRIRLSPTPYSGAFNCFWRMLREEGLASFYQGWGFQVASVTASFASTFLVEMGEEDLGDDDLDGF